MRDVPASSRTVGLNEHRRTCIAREFWRHVGTLASPSDCLRHNEAEVCMNQLIYLVGLIVVILAILSFFGLR